MLFVILKIKWRQFLIGKWRGLCTFAHVAEHGSASPSINHPVRFSVVMPDSRTFRG